MILTDAQRVLLEDKYILWDRAARQGSMDMRDYNRRAAEALKTALAIASASREEPRSRQEGAKPWRPGTETPAVDPRRTAYFIVAVRRASSGLTAHFPAQYLNAVPLLSPDEDEPEVHTGWYCLEAEGDDPAAYYPTLSEGDELLGWCELPDLPATLTGGQPS